MQLILGLTSLALIYMGAVSALVSGGGDGLFALGIGTFVLGVRTLTADLRS